MTKRETPDLSTMQAVPQKEHQWLQKLVGEWSYEGEAPMAPGMTQPMKFTGTETVRSIGGLWVVAESKGTMPDGQTATMIMTIGYDTSRKRYVGSWIGSMMTYLWQYEGALEGDNTLTLDSEGPSMTAPGTMARFKDSMEFKGDKQRVLASRMLGEDGNWHEVMKMTYRRSAS